MKCVHTLCVYVTQMLTSRALSMDQCLCVCVYETCIRSPVLCRFFFFLSFLFCSPHGVFTLFTAFVAPPLAHRTHIVYEVNGEKKRRHNHRANGLKRDQLMCHVCTPTVHVQAIAYAETRLITNKKKEETKRREERKKNNNNRKQRVRDSKHCVRVCVKKCQ